MSSLKYNSHQLVVLVHEMQVMSTTVATCLFVVFSYLSMVPPIFESMLSWVRKLACISELAKYAVAV